GIGDNLTLPSTIALLSGNQLQMVGIDLRNEQRNIVLHPMIARIRYYDVPGLGKRTFDIGRYRSIHRRKQQARRIPRLAFFDGEIRNGSGHYAEMPGHRIPVLLAGRAVARAEPREVEPRMALQELDEMLAYHSGSAEDTYWDSRLHSCLTIV